MEINSAYVDLIKELAQEVEMEDPIDWGMLGMSEDQAYSFMTLNVLDSFKDKYNDPNFREIMLATVVKLVVENFTLNLRLRGNVWS